MKPTLLLLLSASLAVEATAATPEPTGLALAQRFPYSMLGQLTFLSGKGSYVGSGTTVQPRGVLTAGHNLYDADGGWSTDLVFNRGHYNGSDLSRRRPYKIWVMGGYRENVGAYGADSLRSFSRDTGGLSFLRNVADGGFLGWSTDLHILTGNSYKVALGYGAEKHSGEELLGVAVSNPFFSSYQTFYESNNLTIEGGMSGGAIIASQANGYPALCGTIVSGSDGPVLGGIRIVNLAVSNFILRYLSTPTQ